MPLLKFPLRTRAWFVRPYAHTCKQYFPQSVVSISGLPVHKKTETLYCSFLGYLNLSTTSNKFETKHINNLYTSKNNALNIFSNLKELNIILVLNSTIPSMNPTIALLLHWKVGWFGTLDSTVLLHQG